MTQPDRESLTSRAVRFKFQTLPCKTCGHPQGIHGEEGCWAYGLVEAKCRKKCMKFERDNLVYLERKYEELHKALKKAKRKEG